MADNFRNALEDAGKELASLVERRAEIDSRIHKVAQLIKALAARTGADSDDALAPLTLYENRGLSSGVRAALKHSGEWKSAGEVRGCLSSFGYDLSGYANAAAVINTVLNRFVRQGLAAREMRNKTIVYRWKNAGDEILKRGWGEIQRSN